MNYSSSGSSVHGIFQEKYWFGLPFPSPRNLSKPGSSAWQADSLPLSHSQLYIRDPWSPLPNDLNIQRSHPCPGKLAPLSLLLGRGWSLLHLLEGMRKRMKGQWPLRKAVDRKGQGRQPASFSLLKVQLKQYCPCFWVTVGRDSVA